MKITSKGQVTIPWQIRKQRGLLPNAAVEVILAPDGVRIVKTLAGRGVTRGGAAVSALRKGVGHVSMTTDEIVALTRGD